MFYIQSSVFEKCVSVLVLFQYNRWDAILYYYILRLKYQFIYKL